MEIFNSKKFIVFILVLLVWMGVTSCTPTEYTDKESPHQTSTEYQNEITAEMEAMDKDQVSQDNPQPANFTGIAEALGCMFDPAGCERKKEAQKEERKMDR